MPSTALVLNMDKLLQIAESLENVVKRCFGPEGSQVLFMKATGEMLITRDGKTILESLLLDHPIARMIVECASMHYSVTGDGVKTFVILLCSLLRGLLAFVDKQQHPETAKQRRHILKKTSHSLSLFQTRVLDPLIVHHLSKHFLSVYSSSAGEKQLCPNTMQSTLEAYFSGRIGNINHKFMAKLALDFFFQCLACENSESAVVSLIDDLFLDLHMEVTGLPVGSSRILTGIVLPRDFAVYCPAEGDRRALLVTESIHPALSVSDSEFMVKSEAQLQSSQFWMTKQTQAIMKHLQNNQIKVLLSSVKQHEIVLYCAKLTGISVIDCLSAEEISLLSRVAGLSPDYGSVSEMLCARVLTGTAVATLCRPVLLGSRRYAHLGFKKTQVFDPHCVVLCGPVKGLTRQHVSAFHGAFKMLRQLLKAADLSNEHENEPVEQAQVAGAFCNEQGKACSNTRAPKMSADSPVPRDVRPETPQDNGNASGREELQPACRKASEIDEGTRNETVRRNCSAAVNSPVSTLGRPSSRPGCWDKVQQNRTGNCADQRPSISFLKAGSLLPVGGTFEILLHYYLTCHAREGQTPEMMVSTLVADALLGVPQNIYRNKKRNSSFLQFYTSVINALRRREAKQREPQSLESVSCKQQLLASVLQCVTKLVTIDMIVGIPRGPSRKREEDSENDL